MIRMRAAMLPAFNPASPTNVSNRPLQPFAAAAQSWFEMRQGGADLQGVAGNPGFHIRSA